MDDMNIMIQTRRLQLQVSDLLLGWRQNLGPSYFWLATMI